MKTQELAALLRDFYYDKRYASQPYLLLEGVRDRAGSNARRTADAIAFGVWPSRGLPVHGHELKVSRADWLKEMRNPAKADAFEGLVDHWWIVAGDDGIVAAGELPKTWGLLLPDAKGRLRVAVAAPELPCDRTYSRDFLVAALLATKRQAEDRAAERFEERLRDAEEARARAGELDRQFQVQEFERLKAKVRAFEDAAGVRLGGWYADATPAEVGSQLRRVLDGEVDMVRLERRARAMVRQAEQLAEDARRLLVPWETTA